MATFRTAIRSYLESANKKRIHFDDLHDFVLSMYGDQNQYRDNGGYAGFYQVIRELEQEQVLIPLKSAKGNGRIPELRTPWRYYEKAQSFSTWDPVQMVRVSDLVSVQKYMNSPELQTVEEWERVMQVYRFLQGRKDRQWVTREERSFELFQDEKWLAKPNGRAFLNRIGVTLGDLKAKSLGEPFVFWFRTQSTAPLTEVLIVENLSAFHSCKRVFEQGQVLYGLQPDLLIYGEGKRIESSLSFLEELVTGPIVISYAGDLDPEGLGIYVRLREKYQGYIIQLALPIYREMLNRVERAVDMTTKQNIDHHHLETVSRELTSRGDLVLVRQLQKCWTSNKRIPQEVLSYEEFVKGGAIGA